MRQMSADVRGTDEIAETGHAVNKLLEQLQAVLGSANNTLEALASGRFDSRVEVPCKGALVNLPSGINHAEEGVGSATARQQDQARELSRNAEAQRVQNEEISRIAAENTRVRQALDCVSTGAMIADADNRIVYANGSVQAILNAAEHDLLRELPGFKANAIIGNMIDVFHRNPAHQRGMLAGSRGTHATQILVGGRTFALTANPIFANGERLGTVIEWADKTPEKAIEGDIEALVNAAGSGDFSRRISLEGKTGFFANLVSGLNNLTTQVGETIDAAAAVLGGSSEGDLRNTMDSDYAGTLAELQRATNETIGRLT